MKRIFSLFLLALALLSLSAPSWASVIYVSGDQTGTWAADTVIVTAEVRVPPGQSLTILPGVEVLFSVYCKLIVDSAATLQAVGTEADFIRFDALQDTAHWHGIRFLSASDSCRLEYCYLTHGKAIGSGEDLKGGAIYCSSSSPTISKNGISDNTATGLHGSYGGGIYCYESNPIISGNTISGNSAYSCGGGIYCESSSPTVSYNAILDNVAGGFFGGAGGGIFCYNNSNPIIISNTIRGNLAEGSELYPGSGGGIRCDNASPTISNNTISENIGTGGGGISCYGCNPIISGNTIHANSASGFYGVFGGGILCAFSSPNISGNTISGNSTMGAGGGIVCLSSSPNFIGNTLSGNSAGSGSGLYCQDSSLTLLNCILWGNGPQQFYLETGSVLQATYCDIQDTLWTGEGNISADPLFVDPANGDYHLQSTVGSYHGGQWLPDPLHSPCVDAGDPGSPFVLEPMPNGGRINMGFEGNTAEASLSTSNSVPPLINELPGEFHLYAPSPNPFNPTTVLSFELRVPSHVSLRVYDTAGKLVATLVDGWRQAGSQEVTFDGSGLASGIYLAKLTAGSYTSTQKLVLMK